MPEVSVVVTTYNRKEFLSETINSILNQTFSDFELIVVDNFSNYNFIEHINSFKDSRIFPFQNQNNGIIAVNRNYGIRQSKGKYIAFCDDDDIWVVDKLEKQIDFINNTDSDFVSSGMFLFRNSINEKCKIQKNRLITDFDDFLKGNQINTSTVLVRKTNSLFFKEDEVLLAVEDFALWLKLYELGFNFGFIDEPLVYYRLSDNQSKKYWAINHLRIIYLLISIKIVNPKIKINKQLFRHLCKYLVKMCYSMTLNFFNKTNN